MSAAGPMCCARWSTTMQTRSGFSTWSPTPCRSPRRRGCTRPSRRRPTGASRWSSNPDPLGPHKQSLPCPVQNLGGAMSARDELAAILREAAEGAISSGLPVLTHEGYADAVVAAGWRSPPKVIIDPAELAELADGTVILDALGVPRQLT